MVSDIIFRVTGRAIPITDDYLLFENAITRICKHGEKPFFVQIGANDGVSFDKLYPFIKEHDLPGLSVEPVKSLYDRLVENYRQHSNIKIIRKALHADKDTMTMYVVDDGDKRLPNFSSGIASFYWSHHLKSNIPSEAVKEEVVECMTWDELLSDHSVVNVDILQVDAEGYDYEIMKMIDLEKYDIKIIRLEHGVGSGVMSRTQLKKIYNRLRSHRYLVAIGENDLTAVSKDLA